jgi:hypothetical protein
VTETNVFQLSQPGAFTDQLTEVLRNGARALLARAVEAEQPIAVGAGCLALTPIFFAAREAGFVQAGYVVACC